MRIILIFFLLFSQACAGATSSQEDANRHAISVNGLALAPNAGGQEAYRLEWYHNHHAVYGFNNRSLLVGNSTLMALGYNYRLPVCDASCFWQFFTQIGGGISNAGIYGEISWGTIIPLLPIWLPTSSPLYFPALRVDISTQFFASRQRVITWSYPLWAGLTVSF